MITKKLKANFQFIKTQLCAVSNLSVENQDIIWSLQFSGCSISRLEKQTDVLSVLPQTLPVIGLTSQPELEPNKSMTKFWTF